MKEYKGQGIVGYGVIMGLVVVVGIGIINTEEAMKKEEDKKAAQYKIIKTDFENRLGKLEQEVNRLYLGKYPTKYIIPKEQHTYEHRMNDIETRIIEIDRK